MTPDASDSPSTLIAAEHPYPELALYINGRWTRGSGSDELTVHNPATDEALGVLPLATDADVTDAMTAAVDAADMWRRTSPRARRRILLDAAQILRDDASATAELITVELGKPIGQSRTEVVTATEHIDWAAEEGCRAYGRVIPSRTTGSLQVTRREPLGPIAAFAPWNAPLITPARKVSSALAAGCTVVIKLSEETPATALSLVRALDTAGLPPGVLNAVFGDPAAISNRILGDSRIKGVTFTGSTAIGRRIAELSAPSMKRMVLELGGHAPVIVTEDVDVDAVATSAGIAAFRNSGQVCTSPSRFYIHHRVYDEFVGKFTEHVGGIHVGNGLDERVEMGPVVNESRIAAMTEFTDDARRRGIEIPCGGHRLGSIGSFWAPTVFAGVDNECLVENVEPFGPVAAIAPYTALDDALAQANRLPAALAAYVWTENQTTALRLTDEIDAGSVVVNSWAASFPETPFGGYDDSGIGTEGGIEGIAVFQRIKYSSFTPTSRR